MGGSPFKERRDSCTFVICGEGTSGEEKAEIIVVDRNTRGQGSVEKDLAYSVELLTVVMVTTNAEVLQHLWGTRAGHPNIGLFAYGLF